MKVNQLLKESMKQTREEFRNKLEEDSKANHRLYCNILKNLQKDNKYKLVKGKSDEVITESNAIVERWKEYFEDLLNPEHQHNQRRSRKEC